MWGWWRENMRSPWRKCVFHDVMRWWWWWWGILTCRSYSLTLPAIGASGLVIFRRRLRPPEAEATVEQLANAPWCWCLWWRTCWPDISGALRTCWIKALELLAAVVVLRTLLLIIIIPRIKAYDGIRSTYVYDREIGREWMIQKWVNLITMLVFFWKRHLFIKWRIKS